MAAEEKEPEVNQNSLLLKALVENGGNKKKKGLGRVWGSSTDAIGEVFDTVNTLAMSGHALARQAENHALLGEAESAQELLALYGIEAEGYEAIVAADQLKKLLRG